MTLVPFVTYKANGDILTAGVCQIGNVAAQASVTPGASAALQLGASPPTAIFTEAAPSYMVNTADNTIKLR